MPDTLGTLFSKKEELILRNATIDLSQKENNYKAIKETLLQSEKKITDALATLNESYPSPSFQILLTDAIQKLEHELNKETNHHLMAAKYASLACFLEEQVSKGGMLSEEERNKSYARFMSAFSPASSKTKELVVLGFRIALFVLVIGLAIALHFLLPLIPLKAAFLLLKFPEKAAAGTAFFIDLLIEIGIIFGVSFGLDKMVNHFSDSLGAFFQPYSAEYKQAAHIKECTAGFFAKSNVSLPPQQNSTVEKALEEHTEGLTA